ncbi:hypothetical protein BH23DEI1_BH23DEI1_16070 [soil metagenome]
MLAPSNRLGGMLACRMPLPDARAGLGAAPRSARPGRDGDARRAPVLAAVATCLLVLVACVAPEREVAIVPQPLVTLPSGAWSLVPLGGAARCADGSAYAAQVRPGDLDHLVVFFQGGGATWGEIPGATALVTPLLGSLYVDRVTPVADAGLTRAAPSGDVGAATQVVVSYCSGDVHWGDAVGVDGAGEPILHSGAANVRAVLDWLDAQSLTPERLDVVGCSAGAYGALMWSTNLRDLYPTAARSLLLDAGLGVVQAPFVEGTVGLASWNAGGAYRDNGFDDLVDDPDIDYFERLVAAAALGFGGPIGVASTDRDLVQAAFWYLTDDDRDTFAGAIDLWSEAAVARLARLDALAGVSTYLSDWVRSSAPIARPAIATGHCFVGDDDLWDPDVGAPFRDWWAALRAGAAPPGVDVRDE